jgi:hypothetical protein
VEWSTQKIVFRKFFDHLPSHTNGFPTFNPSSRQGRKNPSPSTPLSTCLLSKTSSESSGCCILLFVSGSFPASAILPALPVSDVVPRLVLDGEHDGRHPSQGTPRLGEVRAIPKRSRCREEELRPPRREGVLGIEYAKVADGVYG